MHARNVSSATASTCAIVPAAASSGVGTASGSSCITCSPVTVSGWLEAGKAIYDWLAARPEVDAQHIGLSGRSFGSFFSTLAAAAEPRFKACAVSGTCLEPGCHSIFEEAPPTFRRRFMYMAGCMHDERFDAFRKTLTWEGHAEKIRMPYLCVTGEFDALSPLEVIQLFEEVGGRPFEVSHVPVEALQAQRAAATDPLEQSVAALMLALAAGDPIDMRPVLDVCPVDLMSVRDYAETALSAQHV